MTIPPKPRETREGPRCALCSKWPGQHRWQTKLLPEPGMAHGQRAAAMAVDLLPGGSMNRYMTLEEAVAGVVEKHGGIRATERALGIDKSFLSRLLRGQKTNPSEETLTKLGLRAVPRYERIGRAA